MLGNCQEIVHLVSCVICGRRPGHVPACHQSTCATCLTIHDYQHWDCIHPATQPQHMSLLCQLDSIPILTKYFAFCVKRLLCLQLRMPWSILSRLVHLSSCKFKSQGILAFLAINVSAKLMSNIYFSNIPIKCVYCG